MTDSFQSQPSREAPFWSVMIPTYNPREEFLRQALDSVLRQSLPAGEMQIRVLDDCSPDENVKEMVQAIGGNRIEFSRNARNLGLAGCWNACIEQATGNWVHILHQDDYLLPGFYDRLTELASVHPDVALVASRTFIVDESNVILEVTPRHVELESGGNATEVFLDRFPFQCAGVAVRRSFYEQHGKFREDLTYALDCEMWIRAAFLGGCVLAPEVLACFRTSKSSETKRLRRSAETIKDAVRMVQMLPALDPAFPLRANLLRLYGIAFDEANRFRRGGDFEAAAATRAYFRKDVPPLIRLRVYASRIARRLSRLLCPWP